MISRLLRLNYTASASKVIRYQSKRSLHIRGSYPVYDELNKISLAIIETGNDQREDEDYTPYVTRSLIDLSRAVPLDIQNKVICWAKINTTIIDHIKWKNGELKPIYTGHLAVGLGRIEDNVFKICADAVISKVPNPPDRSPFQDAQDFIERALIASKERYTTGFSRNSREYFCFFSLDKTKITIKGFKEKCTKLKLEKEPYHPIESNCTHAGYEVLTGEKNNHKISTQTAFSLGLFAVLNKKEGTFYWNLRKAISKSGLKLSGYERGEELHRQNNKAPQP